MKRGKTNTEFRPEEIFAPLYESYSPVVYRLAFRWLGNYEEALDITNSAFLKLHQALTIGKPIDNPKTWIYSVAVNLCRDSIRRTIKYRGILREKYREHSRMETAHVGNNEQEIALIRAALGQLPERDRILLLLYQDGFSYTEMAQATGIRATSIGKSLSRAIARLTSLLKNGDDR
jgi:RNA polymerase sigma-70 factor (ECF subfamily)